MSNCCSLNCYSLEFHTEFKKGGPDDGKIIQADKSNADIYTIGNTSLYGRLLWDDPF
jgi:hypothetical protein